MSWRVDTGTQGTWAGGRVEVECALSERAGCRRRWWERSGSDGRIGVCEGGERGEGVGDSWWWWSRVNNGCVIVEWLWKGCCS